MKNSSASSEVLTGDHQTGSQHKRGHEPLFDAYIFYVTVGTYITALSKLFLTLSRCVGSNLVSKLQGPREARIGVNFKHEWGQSGKASQAAPQGDKQLGGWTSLGEEGHQEKGRLQSLHICMHAHVPARTHVYAHTHAST